MYRKIGAWYQSISVSNARASPSPARATSVTSSSRALPGAAGADRTVVSSSATGSVPSGRTEEIEEKGLGTVTIPDFARLNIYSNSKVSHDPGVRMSQSHSVVTPTGENRRQMEEKAAKD